MTGFGAGSFPDVTRTPTGEERGTVVILAGLHEAPADYSFLLEQLLLAGFGVTLFADVCVDAAASRLGALRLFEGAAQTRPVVLVGTDLGAIIALGLVVDAKVKVAGVIVGGLVTSSSRPSTVNVDDFEARAAEGARGVVHEARIPTGFRLPRAEEVRVPVLVFHGDADDVTGVADAVSWASLLPFGSLRLVPQGDHHVLTGEARRTVAASIVLFLERQRAGRPVVVDGFASTGGRST